MNRKIVNAVYAQVDGLFDDMVLTLQELVRIPSVTGGEGPAQEFMRRQYDSLGIEVHSLIVDKSKVQGHYAFCDSGKPFEGRPNIIGIHKGDRDKNSIILNGHVDVIPPEPLDQWKHDPWGAEIEGNRLYGRGALDMKAGVVANLFALKALRNAELTLGGTIMLQSVIEEEDGGGGGTLACFTAGYTGDGMIVSEPAPWVTIALAGILRCVIRVQGKSAHPAQSHLGVNAIGKIIPVYQAVEQLDARRKAQVRFPLFEEVGGPACHLIVGYLRAGEWIATVPGAAEMGCRVGFVPGETREEIRNLIENTVAHVAKQDVWLREHPPQIEWQPFQSDPYYQDPAHPFVQTMVSAAREVAEDETKVKARGATWTEDTRLGQFFGIPGVSIGPQGERPHGVDECVYLDSLKQTTKAIALAAYEWCSRDKVRPTA